MIDIVLDWHFVENRDDDPRWRYTRGLYAYLSPRGREVLYVGKANGCSVKRRWLEKDAFWRDLECDRRLQSHRVIVADVSISEGCRLTRELLADVETLLICVVKPWGNIQCRSTRIQRADLIVRCHGSWPITKRTFRDE